MFQNRTGRLSAANPMLAAMMAFDGDAATGGAATPEVKSGDEAVTLFVQAREEYHAEVKKFGEATQETKNKIEELQAQLDKFEAKTNRPAIAGAAGSEMTPEVKSFLSCARKGEKGLGADEIKTLATDSDPDGGYLVPTNMVNAIIQKLIEVSPIRELADVVTISAGDTMEFPAEGDQEFAGGWVSERGSRTETQSAKLRMVKITAHELYANPFISQKLLDDSAFNVEQWLTGRIATTLAKMEGAAFVSGDGNGKPQGLLSATGVSEVVSGNASAITADALLNLLYNLPEFYANNATWLFKRATLGAIRLLKDSQNQYLWQPGLTAGQPGTLLGRPYAECVDMPAVEAGAYPVIFGDIRAAYQVVDRQGIRVLRDPFSSKPFIEFYTTKRTGGAVVKAEALRKLKIAAS